MIRMPRDAVSRRAVYGTAVVIAVIALSVFLGSLTSGSGSKKPGASGSPTASTPSSTPTSPRPTVAPDGTPLIPVDVPKGYTRDFSADFNTPAPPGQFANVYGWQFKPGYDGGRDTSGLGLYDSSKVLSVSDGKLIWNMHTEGGVPRVAVPVPANDGASDFRYFEYGQWSTAIRASATGPGYKLAFLLWPKSNQWTNEVDFPEADVIPGPVKAVSLISGSPETSTGPQFSGSPNEGVGVTLADGAWHTYLLTWTPDSLTASIDGKVVQRFPASAIPHQPMRVTLQAETWINRGPVPAASTARIEMAWMYINTLNEH